MIYVCIACGRRINQDNDFVTPCPTCGWFKCPECGGCICTVTPEAKVAAIATWLTECQAEIPEDVYNGWLKFLKLLTGHTRT